MSSISTSHASGNIVARQCLSEGWRLFRAEPGKYIGFTLLTLLCSLPSLLMQESDPMAAAESSMGAAALLNIVTLVIAPALMLGYYIVAFKQIDGGKPSFGDFFGGFRYLVPLMLFILVLVIALIVLIALPIIAMVLLKPDGGFDFLLGAMIFIAVVVFTVVPTVAVVIYFFVPMLLVDRKLPFWKAMEASRKAVAGNVLLVFRLMFVSIGVQLLGFLALGIGLLAATPVTYLMMAVAYRELFGGSAEPSGAAAA